MTRSIHTARYETLRRLLVAARKEAGLTQEQVAARIRRPQSYLSKVEHGDRRLDVVEFLELAEAISADAQDLVRQIAAIGSKGSKRR